jgi:hypothetical protein
MKFCDAHWTVLRAAIQTRGLWHLVAPDGVDAARRVQAELDGEAVARDYDPLMAAYWMITGRALECGGPYLMGQKPDGADYCPLCELEEKSPAKAADWIEPCCDSVLERCRKLGLLGAAS